MKKIWDQIYKKGLRNPLVSKNAVCKDNKIVFSIEYGGNNFKTDVVRMDLITKEFTSILTESNSVRTVGVLEDNKIYFSSFNGMAYCINLEGDVFWKTNIGGGNASFEVLIDEDRIYFFDNALYCLNKKGGAIVWINECESNDANCTFALSNQYLFHAETDGKIRCFDKMTGEQIWEYGYQLYTEHCELIGDKLVTLQSDGTAIILNPETGKK